MRLLPELRLLRLASQAALIAGIPVGGQRCTTLSNGVLTVSATDRGASVLVDYYRKGGGSTSGRLGYERNGNNKWGRWQDMTTTPLFYSDQFRASASCSPVIGKLNSGRDTFATPALPTC